MNELLDVLRPLPPEGVSYELVAMLTPSHAVDLFLGDLQRKSRSKNSGKTAYDYGRILDEFVGSLGDLHDVTRIVPDHARRYLNRYGSHSAGYQHTIYSYLNSFFGWLYKHERIRRNPLDHIARPRRIAPDDLDVTTISTIDVTKLLAAAQNHSERLAIAIPTYMGPRRNAIALLRLRDFNRDTGHIRLREKGGKVIWKPVASELVTLIEWAIADGEIVEPTDYLVPPQGYLHRKGDRDDRVIWRLVKKVADRIGVEAHVHALRAAFAVFYLEQHPGDIVGLQELLGHESIETTRVYLRKLNKAQAMEPVRSLSWAAVAADNGHSYEIPVSAGFVYESSLVVGAGGFEPPFDETPHEHSDGTEPGDPRPLDEALLAQVIDLGAARERLRG